MFIVNFDNCFICLLFIEDLVKKRFKIETIRYRADLFVSLTNNYHSCCVLYFTYFRYVYNNYLCIPISKNDIKTSYFFYIHNTYPIIRTDFVNKICEN